MIYSVLHLNRSITELTNCADNIVRCLNRTITALMNYGDNIVFYLVTAKKNAKCLINSLTCSPSPPPNTETDSGQTDSLQRSIHKQCGS